MPTSLRQDAPGALHHVMMRGVDGRAVFSDAADRLWFLSRLTAVLPPAETRCLAWCLMTNHVHLVVQTGATPLSAVMHRVNSAYASAFNTRHDRRGYLFQSRFKSRLARDDADVMTLIRYVHRNPLQAGLVANLEALGRYPWCGHGGLAGLMEARPFHSVEVALGYFEPRREACARLLAWMRDRSPERSLRGIGESIAMRAGLRADELRSRSRERRLSEARIEFIREAMDRHGYQAVEVAKWLGVSQSAVSHARRRSRSKNQLSADVD